MNAEAATFECVVVEVPRVLMRSMSEGICTNRRSATFDNYFRLDGPDGLQRSQRAGENAWGPMMWVMGLPLIAAEAVCAAVAVLFFLLQGSHSIKSCN